METGNARTEPTGGFVRFQALLRGRRDRKLRAEQAAEQEVEEEAEEAEKRVSVSSSALAPDHLRVPNRIPNAPKLAPFNPTTNEAIAKAVELLDVRAGDTVFDLGCGDGRFLVAAAQLGSATKCVGVEYDGVLAARARDAVTKAGLDAVVEIVHGDALTADLSSATKLFIYLVPAGLRIVLPVLEEMRARGIPVVAYTFTVPGWEPTHHELMRGGVSIYLYEHGRTQGIVQGGVGEENEGEKC